MVDPVSLLCTRGASQKGYEAIIILPRLQGKLGTTLSTSPFKLRRRLVTPMFSRLSSVQSLPLDLCSIKTNVTRFDLRHHASIAVEDGTAGSALAGARSAVVVEHAAAVNIDDTTNITDCTTLELP